VSTLGLYEVNTTEAPGSSETSILSYQHIWRNAGVNDHMRQRYVQFQSVPSSHEAHAANR
jgi:hypothetical protein